MHIGPATNTEPLEVGVVVRVPMRELRRVQDQAVQFGFDVGDRERHHVEFSFNQALGPLRITVDDKVVVRSFRMFSRTTTERFAFRVGRDEVHDVAIDKTRALILAGVRRQTCRVLVDGEEFGRYPGSLSRR